MNDQPTAMPIAVPTAMPIALITGAGSGLGRATAQRLAADGYAIVCLDVVGSAAQATTRDIESRGGSAWSVECDISDESSVARGVAEALAHAGHIDLLVNAAGVASNSHFLEQSLSEWQRLLDINLTGTFLMCREVLPALLESQGSIVNVSSISALRGWRYMAAYAATKAGIIALTKSLAVEFGFQGVRVNCVAPGGIATPLAAALSPVPGADPRLMDRGQVLTDPGRAEADEIAGSIAYLASKDARFVTGTVLIIDGGVMA
jgi:meso-butanediol dehydrogenase/(S,S)-butanediol dehydrogenase/diacetyl reductase